MPEGTVVAIKAWDDTNKVYRRVEVNASSELLLALAAIGSTALTSRDISGDGLGFDGTPYENEKTQANDNPNRFETTALKLKGGLIRVTTHDQLFGDATNQRFLVEAGQVIAFSYLDISKVYFKNANAGDNGVINIFAARDTT